MAQTVERLIASLEARTKEYEKALAKAKDVTVTQMRGIEKEIEHRTTRTSSLFDKMGGSIKHSLQAALAGFTLHAAIHGLEEVIHGVAELADNARRAGVEVEKFQEILFAGQQEGAGPDKTVAAMEQLNVELGEAVTQGNNLGKLLAANNVPIKKANGELRDTADIMLDIADLIKNAGSAQERALIAQVAFGRAGKELLPFLVQGADAIRAQMQGAKDAGAVISAELVAKAKEFDIQLNLALATMSAMAKSEILDLMVALVEKAKGFAGYMAAAGNSSFFKRLNDFLGVDPAAAQAAFDRARFGSQGGSANSLGAGTYGSQAQAAAGGKSDRTKIPDFSPPPIHIDHTLNRQSEAFIRLKEAEKALADEQKRLNELAGIGADVFKGIFADLRSGVSILDSVTNALNRLADRLADMAIDQAFAWLLAALTGPGAIAPGVGPGGMGFTHFGGPRAKGGGVSAGTAYRVGESGPETFVPNTSGTILPHGAVGSTKIEVINMRGQDTVVEQRKGDNGNPRLVIRALLESEIPGILNRIMPAQYGISPRLRRT